MRCDKDHEMVCEVVVQGTKHWHCPLCGQWRFTKKKHNKSFKHEIENEVRHELSDK